MFLKRIVTVMAFTGLCISGVLAQQQRPFPMQLTYPGVIKPTNVTQAAMNNAIQNSYSSYKTSYLKTSKFAEEYYILSGGTGGTGTEITISEAHGYGMMIFALMAGYDASAKTYFDGMYKYFKRFPSTINNKLMSWNVLSGEVAPSGATSATDGDMDIAYALLMAHDQWGSAGAIDYLTEAKTLIGAIKSGEVSATTYRIKLGDWAKDSWNVNNKYNTRSSDWMAGHVKAYKKVTADSFWDNVHTTIYSLISAITTNYSSTTGLMPDFITGVTPAPDPNSGGTGEPNGDNYYWNACRYPWRITMDYLHYGTARSKTAMVKLMDWAVTKTGGDPGKFYPGYTLAGNALTTNYTEIAFIAPIVLASIVDSKYQTFLNSGWTKVAGWSNPDVYGQAIQILSMMAMSGNWWAPGEAIPGNVKKFTITASAGTGGTISPSGSISINEGTSQALTIVPFVGYTIDSVLVNGVNAGAVASYSFSNVNKNHTIRAVFKFSQPIIRVIDETVVNNLSSQVISSRNPGYLSLTLFANEKISVNLYKLNGEFVSEISFPDFVVFEETIIRPIPLVNHNGENLSTGIHIIMVTMGKRRFKFMVIIAE